MAHIQQLRYVGSLAKRYPDFFSNKSVLEIGSLDINGTIRTFFTDCNYIGLDVGQGKGVDIVCRGEEYDAPENSFDVTCSTECFEHTDKWAEIFSNMHRMTKQNGLIFFTCASVGRGEHGTTRTTPNDSPFTYQTDYYRNLTEGDFSSIFRIEEMFNEWKFEFGQETCDLYFYGIKR